MRYRANPVEVEAHKIVSVSADKPCHVALDNGENRTVDDGMTARMWPLVGDYLVIQSDGYEYLNPRDVFERKYSPVLMDNGEQRQP